MKIASIVIAAVAVGASIHLGARAFAQDDLYQGACYEQAHSKPCVQAQQDAAPSGAMAAFERSRLS